jgi:hypothetical protein
MSLNDGFRNTSTKLTGEQKRIPTTSLHTKTKQNKTTKNLKNTNKDSKHTGNNTNTNNKIEIALAQQQQHQQSSNNNSRDHKMYAFCSSVRVSLFWLNLASWEIVFFFL